MIAQPETYILPPTAHVPNSTLPALVYRKVLDAPSARPRPSSPTTTSSTPEAEPITADTITEQLSRNHWHLGGVFKTFTTHHFHSVTHELYAVFKGRSTLLLGRGPTDDSKNGTEGGVQVVLEAGDVIVLPAGVAHCSIDAEGGYEYVGLYPEGSPKWDNNFCLASAEETEEKGRVSRLVPVPRWDPVYGADGPLVKIWDEAAAGSRIGKNGESI